MNSIRLIRNRWLISLVAMVYGTALWGGFQLIYRYEIELHRLARMSPTDPHGIVRLYEVLARSRTQRTNLDTFIALGDLLERIARWNEAAATWRRIVDVLPEQEWPQQRLALALYNAGRYAEAETHFIELLGERAKGR